jgi:hypothetical protein
MIYTVLVITWQKNWFEQLRYVTAPTVGLPELTAVILPMGLFATKSNVWQSSTAQNYSPASTLSMLSC